MSRPKCTATAKSSGNGCKRFAIDGGTVCEMHGGKAPQVKRKAAERKVIAEATGLLSKHGDATPVTDPLAALLMLAGRAERFLVVIEQRVDELTSIRYKTEAGEQLRAEIAAYMTMLDRCRQVLVDILRLNIEDRLTRVQEQQVRMVADALAAGLRDAGLEDRTPEVVGHVRRHLRVVA